MYSDGERFLLDFHRRQPGVTAHAFGKLPVAFRGERLASSYAVLVHALPAEASTVLDVGCGDGHLLSLLAATHPAVRRVGVDFSLGELHAAPAAVRGRLAAARAQALPLRDASVDAVLSHMALMLMNDAAQVVQDIARVLVPGGMLAAVVGGPRPPSPAFDTYLAILRRHLAALPTPAPRLGDGAFFHDERTRALLDPHFTDIGIDPVTLEERLTPEALWAGYERMYDLYHLAPAARDAIRHEYLATVRTHVDADGLLALPQQLRCIQARRR